MASQKKSIVRVPTCFRIYLMEYNLAFVGRNPWSAETALIIRKNDPPPPAPENKKGKKSPLEPLLERALEDYEKFSPMVFGLPATYIV